ncbi:MAG TPA: hypothetical protein VHT04_04565 [Stellaceae bacterium]|nr:hypothetical protein [Stellaceae bacterium]
MQRLAATILIAATAILLAQAVKAGPKFADDDAYEAAYLAACGAHLPPGSCQCVMEVIEDTLSFDAFAALVERFGGDIRRVLPAERVDPAVEQSCGVADLSGSQTTAITQRARQPD